MKSYNYMCIFTKNRRKYYQKVKGKWVRIYDKRKTKMHKCNVDKNGAKRYYQKFNGKWNRISNDAGKKAEKGKKKYRMKNPSGPDPLFEASSLGGSSSGKKQCHVCFDDKDPDKGAICVRGHFVCKEDFVEFVKGVLENPSKVIKQEGNIICSGYDESGKCTEVIPYEVIGNLLSKYGEEGVKEFMNIIQTTTKTMTEDEEVRKMEKAIQKLTKEHEKELAESGGGRRGDDIDRKVRHIRGALSLRTCPNPECGKTFFDFTGCGALTCDRCGIRFCSLCNNMYDDESKGREERDSIIHKHVRECVHNPENSAFIPKHPNETSPENRPSTYWWDTIHRRIWRFLKDESRETQNAVLKKLEELKYFKDVNLSKIGLQQSFRNPRRHLPGCDKVRKRVERGEYPQSKLNEKILDPEILRNVDGIECLLIFGADVDAKDENGWTPLHHASVNGHTKVVRLLLEWGAEVDAKDKYENTPLHLACYTGHTEVARLLLERGAEVDAKDENGQTALHRASGEGHVEVARLLLERGAEVDVKRWNGETPLHIASIGGHTEVAKLLLERGAEVDAKDKKGNTPISFASRKGHGDIVKLLLKNGADKKDINTTGRGPGDERVEAVVDADAGRADADAGRAGIRGAVPVDVFAGEAPVDEEGDVVWARAVRAEAVDEEVDDDWARAARAAAVDEEVDDDWEAEAVRAAAVRARAARAAPVDEEGDDDWAAEARAEAAEFRGGAPDVADDPDIDAIWRRGE